MDYAQQGSQTMVGSSGGNASTAPKSPSVVEQLNQQEKSIQNAHNAVDVLVDRLALLLGPVPGIDKANGAPTPVPNQISQRVPLHTRSIDALVARLSELTGRIEL